MNNSTFKELVKKDIQAYINMLNPQNKKDSNQVGLKDFIIIYMKYPVYRVVFCMRLCFAIEKVKVLKPLYFLEKWRYRRFQVKYGVQTGHRLNPEGGFFIGHFGGIVIHEGAEIGENLIMHQNTSIGTTDRGVPKIGKNVTIGANVCIIGDIVIGDNCTIGAGSVVTKSFTSGSIIAGNPARRIGERTIGHRTF